LSIAIASLLVLIVFGILTVLVMARIVGTAIARNQNRPAGAQDEGEQDLMSDETRAKKAKEQLVRSLGWALASFGILVALAGVAFTFVQGAVNNVVPSTFLSIVLGLVGFLMGARRIGATAAVLSVIALMFGVAASQGLVHGVERPDRNLPAVEPDAQRPSSVDTQTPASQRAVSILRRGARSWA
jgi:hypothetical protein